MKVPIRAMRSPRVVIAGAGIGGLTAALELANQGSEVTVVERGPVPGGKLREQTVLGRRIDAGPTVFTMRPVFEEIFSAAGASLARHLSLKPLDILARHAWSAGERLDLHADSDRSAEAIGAFAGPGEARRYLAFCERSRRVFESLEHPFIRASRPSPFTLARRVGARGLENLGRIYPFGSLWRALGNEFRDPRLRQLFGRYATYMGSSPFAAPATLMLITHVERSGVWTVEGGMYRVVEAMCRVAANLGVRFRYGAEAGEVLLRGNRVAGLTLDDGEILQADAVIVNADFAAVAGGRFGAAIKRAAPALPRGRRSLSAVTWALVARAEGFPLHRHTVFFSADYASEFKDIFKRSRLPETPTVYVCAQDREDGGGSPRQEAERLFCLINAPAVGDIGKFDEAELEQCRRRAFGLLERCGLRLDMDRDACRITAPHHFEKLFPGSGGALYGPASHGWRASFRRPGARTRVPGLYLAGGSAHPGAGMPMAALSGRQAAFALLRDAGRKP